MTGMASVISFKHILLINKYSTIR